MPEIQILICAYGPDALERIAGLPHASAPGVEYLVSWQRYNINRIPPAIRDRKDFKVYFEESEGLCNNRNSLLDKTDADIAVISDDDLSYSPEHLCNLRESFLKYPAAHILTFRYASDCCPKSYPTDSFDLAYPPKGYFTTSMEVAFNLKQIRKDFGNIHLLRFNPAFGVNGTCFGSGEEDLLMARLLRHGFLGRFVPADICFNTESTTSDRISLTKGFIETKGACMTYLKPLSWFPRMVAHALRTPLPFLRYCSWWLSGVRKARRMNVFENY